ncbi:MAG: hypothetical protein E7041_01560 [Lentisphaerae bacterium]|nr:hypothetical protein [Lentisphaerota bacterium]
MKKLCLAAMMFAGILLCGATVFTHAEYDATAKGIKFPAAKGMLDPAGGSIEFTFTGNFSKNAPGKSQLYMLCYSGRTQIGVNRFASGRMRLFFFTRNSEGKNAGVEKVVKISAGKPFQVKLVWGNGESTLYCDGKKLGTAAAVPQFSNYIAFGGQGKEFTYRLADGVFKNIAISNDGGKPAAPAPAVKVPVPQKSSVKVTFTHAEYDAAAKGIKFPAVKGMLNPAGGSIEFTFTGNFSKGTPGKLQTYMLCYSGRTQIGVNQIGSGKLRLFFITRNSENKGVSVEKVVKIAAGKAFQVKVVWGNGVSTLYCDGKKIGTVAAVPQFSNYIAFGGQGADFTYRLADGVFKNIVITADTAAVAAPAVKKTAGVRSWAEDFESVNLKAWEMDSAEGDATVVKIDRRESYTGKRSLRVEKGAYPGDFELISPVAISVRKGEVYELSCRYRLESIKDGYISFGFREENTNGRVIGFKSLAGNGRRAVRNYIRHIGLLPEHSWREFKVTYKAASDRILRFTVCGGDGLFKFNIDRIAAVPAVEPGDRIFSENFAELNLASRDALAGRDFHVDSGSLTAVPGGAHLTLPGQFRWTTEWLMPEVSYRLKLHTSGAANNGKVKLIFADAGEKVLAQYEKDLTAETVMDFTVPATASLSTLTVSGKNGSVLLKNLTVDKNFTVDSQRGIYHNEWQGWALWGGVERGFTGMRRTFTLDAAPAEAYIRYLGHNGAILFVNGRNFGNGSQFQPAVADVTGALQAGKNVLALLVKCTSGGMKGMFELFVRDVNGKEYFIVSDPQTKVWGDKLPDNWTAVDFDDTAWLAAQTRQGSARDFGNGATAAIVNTKQESLYIGPRTELTVSEKKMSASIPEDGTLEIALDGNFPVKNIIGGRVVFTQNGVIFRMDIDADEIELNEKTLTVKFAPRFLMKGEYQAALEIFRTRWKNGSTTLDLGKLQVTPAVNPVALPKAEMRRVNGKPVLHVNGKPQAASWFCHGRPYSREVSVMNKQVGIKIHQMWTNLRDGKPYVSNGASFDDGKGGYKFDEAYPVVFDAAAQLRRDPDAYIIAIINCEPPMSFARDPERQKELLLSSKGFHFSTNARKNKIGKWGVAYRTLADFPADGTRASVSPASPAKREAYDKLVRQAVRYFESTPLAQKIIGYAVAGEMDQQLYPYIPYAAGVGKFGRFDYSPVMLQYFRNYLKQLYRTDAALQQAWQDPSVTLENAMIPAHEEHEGKNFFISRAAADYYAAFAQAGFEAVTNLTRAMKEECGNRAIVWSYPKDNAAISGTMHFGGKNFGTHCGYSQYTEKSVDSFGNPGDYTMRRNGLPSANYGAPASARFHNKVLAPEMDLRSFVIGAYSTSFNPATLFISRAHWAKETMDTLKNHMGFRIYTFWPGWLNNAGVMDEVRILQNILTDQMSKDIRWKPQVCLLFDAESGRSVGDFTRGRMHFYNGSVGAFALNEVSVAGAGFDVHYLQDILHDDFPADQYKVFIFINAYQVSAPLRAAIHAKLHAPGKFIIWRWGDGYLNEKNQLDAASVESLTGFKVRPFKPGNMLPLAEVKKSVSPWTNELTGATLCGRYRYNCDPALPYFTLNDPDAQILAEFTGGEDVLGVKKVRGATGIYAALPAVPAQFVRNVYRAAGVHTYTDNEYDFVNTDGHYLSVHSGVGGEKIIRLPEKVARIINVHSGKVVAEHTDVLKFVLRANGTEIFLMQYEDNGK